MLKRIGNFIWAAVIYFILIFGLVAVEQVAFQWLNYIPGHFARILILLINILLPWVMVVSLTAMPFLMITDQQQHKSKD